MSQVGTYLVMVETNLEITRGWSVALDFRFLLSTFCITMVWIVCDSTCCKLQYVHML